MKTPGLSYLGVTSGPAVTQQLSRYRELIDDNRMMKKMAAACEAAVGEEARA